MGCHGQCNELAKYLFLLLLAGLATLTRFAGEYDTAVKYFNRCTQLDDSFAYGYTLAGHEHTSNDNFDKALTAFRSALRVDPRHYNAWCERGLGAVFAVLTGAQVWSGYCVSQAGKV